MHKLRIMYKNKVVQINDNYPFSDNRFFFVNNFEYMSGGGPCTKGWRARGLCRGGWGLIPVADLRGCEGREPPWGSKFFQFHAVFGKNWQNRMLVPPWRVGASTSRNS